MFMYMEAEGTMSESAIPAVTSALEVNLTCLLLDVNFKWCSIS